MDVDLGATILFGGGAAVIFAFYVWRSISRRAIEPMLVVALALLPLAWLEAPGDWVFYAQYNPGFARMPDWGPLSLAHEGLPVIAIPAYPFFWVLPILATIGIARRVKIGALGFGQRLLIIGFGFGFCWDAFFEILATRIGVWRFAYVPWGLSLFTETKHQMTFSVSIVCGLFVMGSAYLVGRVNDRGDDRIMAWARTKVPQRPRTAHFVTMVVFFQVTYALSMVPIYIVKVLGLTWYAAPGPLFEDIPNQTTSGTQSGPAAAAILIGGAILFAAAAFLIVWWLERPRGGAVKPKQAAPSERAVAAR